MIALPAGLISTPSHAGLGAKGTANPTLNQTLPPATTTPGADPSFFALLSDLAAALQGAGTVAPTITKKAKAQASPAAGTPQASPPAPAPADGSVSPSAGVNRPSAAGNHAPQVAPAGPAVVVADVQGEIVTPRQIGSSSPTAVTAGFPNVRAAPASSVAEGSEKAATNPVVSAPEIAENLPRSQGDTAPRSSLRNADERHTGAASVGTAGAPAPAPGTTVLPAGEWSIIRSGLAQSLAPTGQGASQAIETDAAKESGGAKTADPNASQVIASTPGTVGTSNVAPGTGVEAIKSTASLADQVHERITPSLDQLRVRAR